MNSYIITISIVSFLLLNYILFKGNFRTILINYQNISDRKFRENKNIISLLNYLLAAIIFFLSTILTQLKLPYNLIRNLVKKSNKIITSNENNFHKIINKNKIVIVDFWAEWCGPCELMNPFLEEFSKHHEDVKVVKVHALQKKLMNEFNVRGIPQILLFENGKEIKRNIGPMTLTDLENFITQ